MQEAQQHQEDSSAALVAHGNSNEAPKGRRFDEGYVAPHPSARRDALPDPRLDAPAYPQEYLESITPFHIPPRTWYERLGYVGAAVYTRSLGLATSLGRRRPSERAWQRRLLLQNALTPVPNLAAAAVRHLRSLLRATPDQGWIHIFLEDFENERLHEVTLFQALKPNFIYRSLIVGQQVAFFHAFAAAYVLAPRACHAAVQYLEEANVQLYTALLAAMEDGQLPRLAATPAPPAACKYWHLPEGATMREVALALRADSAFIYFSNRIVLETDLGKTNPETQEAEQRAAILTDRPRLGRAAQLMQPASIRPQRFSLAAAILSPVTAARSVRHRALMLPQQAAASAASTAHAAAAAALYAPRQLLGSSMAAALHLPRRLLAFTHAPAADTSPAAGSKDTSKLVMPERAAADVKVVFGEGAAAEKVPAAESPVGVFEELQQLESPVKAAAARHGLGMELAPARATAAAPQHLLRSHSAVPDVLKPAGSAGLAFGFWGRKTAADAEKAAPMGRRAAAEGEKEAGKVEAEQVVVQSSGEAGHEAAEKADEKSKDVLEVMDEMWLG